MLIRGVEVIRLGKPLYPSELYEVQKYLTMTKHVYTPMFLMANANVWKSLTPEQRQIISEEAMKAGKQVQEKEKWYIAQMEKGGIETTCPDAAEAAMYAAMQHGQLQSVVSCRNAEGWQLVCVYERVVLT